MMLYLTGASSSLSKGNEAPQNSTIKSLGGYISSSPVPNNSLNGLFDAISMMSIKDKQRETIAIALVNKFDQEVKDVKLKTLVNENSIAKFRIAAVPVGKDMIMEHINNRYDEPMQAEFYDTSFTRAGVKLKVLNGGEKDDAISLTPFNITAVLKQDGIEGVLNSLIEAFSASENYQAKILSKDTLYIESRQENVVSEPLSCDYVASGSIKLEFLGKYENYMNNEVLICETLKPGEAIGLWIQRDISAYRKRSNEEIIEDYDNAKSEEKVETAELIFNYNFGK